MATHDADEQQPKPPLPRPRPSGGGFRGLYTATVLKNLEEQWGAPLADKFDLICGTSAGGLLALGLAAGLPADTLQAMFERDGERIFNFRGRRGLTRKVPPVFKAKHSPDGLRDVPRENLGELTIGDLKHRVLVPTVNYTKGSGQFFKTPHAEQFVTDYKHRLVDVGLATTAAPTYFPMHEIADEGVFVDGGLVGNSPGFFGLHEAHGVLGVPREPGAVRVLAIGTMTLGATKPGDSGLDWGYAGWGPNLFDLVISTQKKSTDDLLKHLLGPDYLRIDDPATPQQSGDIDKLDVVTRASIEVLRTRGTQAARQALGDPRFRPFREHVAACPTFFHGPNKNSED